MKFNLALALLILRQNASTTARLTAHEESGLLERSATDDKAKDRFRQHDLSGRIIGRNLASLRLDSSGRLQNVLKKMQPQLTEDGDPIECDPEEEPDVGILACSDTDAYCVEHKDSSRGGYCSNFPPFSAEEFADNSTADRRLDGDCPESVTLFLEGDGALGECSCIDFDPISSQGPIRCVRQMGCYCVSENSFGGTKACMQFETKIDLGLVVSTETCVQASIFGDVEAEGAIHTNEYCFFSGQPDESGNTCRLTLNDYVPCDYCISDPAGNFLAFDCRNVEGVDGSYCNPGSTCPAPFFIGNYELTPAVQEQCSTPPPTAAPQVEPTAAPQAEPTAAPNEAPPAPSPSTQTGVEPSEEEPDETCSGGVSLFPSFGDKDSC